MTISVLLNVFDTPTSLIPELMIEQGIAETGKAQKALWCAEANLVNSQRVTEVFSEGTQLA